ncbi:MAG TPA: crosslink repair DNA glycosylase YcaQ family protein, partial [Saprospiraceae bacterium]|nr:crosslink repair DNA glycosylase YcaQ family protein [Saprospiraceae bacterium]
MILAAHGFGKNKPYGAGASSVSLAVQHLGYVQIDTISVVERAHHHVLWSRIPDYDPEWLHQAQIKS